jgi:transposase
MRQYSDDLRGKLIHTWQSWDGSQQELADWWGVSRSWLQKVLGRWRETGQVQAARYRHGPVSRVNPQRVTALVAAHPGATLAELGRRLRVSAPTVCRWLQRLGLPRKKNRCTPASRTRRASKPCERLGGGSAADGIRKSSSLSMKAGSASR